MTYSVRPGGLFIRLALYHQPNRHVRKARILPYWLANTASRVLLVLETDFCHVNSS